MKSSENFLRSGPARFFVLLLAPLCFLFACATAADTATNSQRIVAIGDLHGDYDAFESLAIEAGLMNRRGRWAGDDTIFVQMGDVVDRGPNSLKIFERLEKLKKQAARKGGKVITLVGNHEAMNMTGDLRYVHPGEYEAFETRTSSELRDRIYELNKERIEAAYLETDETLTPEMIQSQWEQKTPLGMIEHQQAWRPDGEIGKIIVANPAIAIVGDSLFVHGGISPDYTSFSVDEINAAVSEALATRAIEDDSIIHQQNGPLWYRGLIERKPAAVPPAGETADESAPETPEEVATPAMTLEEEVDAALAAFGVNRIIVGHTPSLTGINPLHGGKVIQIDTGIADYYGGTRSFLEIKDGMVYAHDNGVMRALSEEGEE